MTQFLYDSQNRMTSGVDARGVTVFQNTYDANGRIATQVQADGGVFQFSYVLTNSLVPTSPVLSTTVIDPGGNPTNYRFNAQGFGTDITDSLGQTKSFARKQGTNEITAITGPVQCDVCGAAGQGPTSYTYDSSGNVLTSTDALGNTATFTYEPTFNNSPRPRTR